MNDLTFSLHQKIYIEGKLYQVTGFIKFVNNSDNNTWTEYKLKKIDNGKIYWLSVDLVYKEYALYTQETYTSSVFSDSAIAASGYKEADKFNAKVIGYEGDVDVDSGERVEGTEFEDSTEELIISIEQWGDEIEYSKGYYLDSTDIRADGVTSNSSQSYTTFNNRSYAASGFGQRRGMFSGGKFIIIVIAIIMLISVISPIISSITAKKKIYNYVNDNSNYTYETSITSTYNEKEKAKVYKSSLSLDATVKNIIDGINGDTEDVSQNDDDNSVAILTDNEYCLVYQSEDEDNQESNDVLVQISSRLYTYTSNSSPYRSSRYTRSFYRGYYYNKAYYSDNSSYGSYTSSYAGEDVTSYDTTTNNSTYNSYSSSVRQSSTSSRDSLGGGSSYGK